MYPAHRQGWCQGSRPLHCENAFLSIPDMGKSQHDGLAKTDTRVNHSRSTTVGISHPVVLLFIDLNSPLNAEPLDEDGTSCP